MALLKNDPLLHKKYNNTLVFDKKSFESSYQNKGFMHSLVQKFKETCERI